MTTSTVTIEICQLYVALFGKNPDAQGFRYWCGVRNIQSMVWIANSMFGTAPARAYYPQNMTNEQIIGAFYLNVLGRVADPGGLAYWTQKLNAAGATVGSVICEMITVVAKYSGTDPAGLKSQALFNKKVEDARASLSSGGLVWEELEPLPALIGMNYTPIMFGPSIGDKMQVYSTRSDTGDLGKLYKYDIKTGIFTKVLTVQPPADKYIRTSAVALGRTTGLYYALLYTGDDYPGTNGYSPSFALGQAGVNWNFKGRIGPSPRYMSSAAALVVDELRNDNYRFMAWVDNIDGRRLSLLHSGDGVTWSYDPEEIWPAGVDMDGSPNFVTVCETPFGYHMIATAGWSNGTGPATAHRHLFSRDGKTWKVLEMEAITNVGNKGTNLAYDRTTNKVYALTQGRLFAFEPKAF